MGAAMDALEQEDARFESKVHISMQQRTGKKCLTLVQGIPERVCLPMSGIVLPVDFPKILHALKTKYNTGGKLIDDPRHGRTIQLQGAFRREVAEFLVYNTALVKGDQITIHGA